MPFANLTSDGLAIACFIGEHDWTKAISVSLRFPDDITDGLSARESRRPEAEAVLLTVALNVWAESSDAQALRQKLATLGKGWIGFPLLHDSFLGADVATAGARVFYAQRLLDLTSPAIVAADSALTSDHVYAPLVVGHITDLPELSPVTGKGVLCAATLTEDSPWTFRLGAFASVATGDFPEELSPDWTSPPTQTPVRELDFDRIGFQREQTIDHEERAFRWAQDAGFTMTTRAEAAALVGFFIASRGRWTPFTVPMWFAPGTGSTEAPNSTKCRFAERVLKIDFTSTTIASARVKVQQVPWEITGTAGETPQQPPRLHLYRITYELPEPQVYRFTNCWRSLARTDDGTYTPAPMMHDEIISSLDLGEDLTLRSFVFDGNPLAMFSPNILEGRLKLEVFELETWPIDPDAATLGWSGYITAAPQEGRRYNATCRWLGGLMDREGPAVRIGPSCNTSFCSPYCGHTRASFLKPGTLSASSDLVVTVATPDEAAANAYAQGVFEAGTGAAWESRTIVASEPVDGGQQFTLDRPIRQAASGQAVAYMRGCDLQVATCKALDPTGWRARFRGFPNLPLVNLSLPTLDVGSASKK